MKCEKCGAEFMPPTNLAASFTACPFCRATIFNEAVAKGYASFAEFLQYIVSIYGQEIYKDKQRLNGLIANFYNGERKRKRAYMRAIADDSISQKVYDILLRPSNEREAYYNKLVANFIETNFYSTEISQQIINDIILGISIDLNQHISDKCKIMLIKATMGNADEQYNLGYCYCKGDGIEQNYTEAVEWFQMAAEQGYDMAQFKLGYCFDKGLGVVQNHTEAVKWYRMAAEQGNAFAQWFLGYYYELGRGIKQNYFEAVKWYCKAAKQKNTKAQYNLESLLTKTSNIFFKWYYKAVMLNDANAQYNLGVCYKYGRGIEQNYNEAVKWYQKAAEQGYANAQNNLGNCYYNGRGVEQNYNEAAKWYQKAAEQGNATAQCNLGVCYEYGRGVGQNYDEAAKWYQKAAKQGYGRAENRLWDLNNKGLSNKGI